MANKKALQDLHQRLVERQKLALELPVVFSWLAVEVGGYGFLMPLTQTSEIVPSASLQSLPHSYPWLLGIANVRGNLVTVIDLIAFLGLPKTVNQYQSVRNNAESSSRGQHLVSFATNLQTNAVLMVDRLLGIKRPEEFQPHLASESDRPHFITGQWFDAAGNDWYVLDLSAIVNDEIFLKVVK